LSDTTLNQFISRGTNAQRVAFTPSPATPASGNNPSYIFYETDTGNTYMWDGSAWQKINTGSGGTSGPIPAGLGWDGNDHEEVIVAAQSPFASPQVPGLVPPSGGGTSNFLRADGTWATPGGGGMDKARVYLSGAFTPTFNVWGKVPIDTVDFDTNSIWDSTNKRFVPKRSGYYLCNMRVRSGSGTWNTLSIAKNGAQTIGVGDDPGSAVIAIGGSGTIFCNGTTDYLEMWGFSTSTHAATTGSFDTWMDVTGPL
jgi:hypothetical protein